MRSFDYHHVVCLEETNLLGNVYYVNLLRWQGRCREHFLRDRVPGLLAEFERGLCLVTTHCSCDFLAEIMPFDEVVVRMRLAGLNLTSLVMTFEYLRRGTSGEELVARGEQKVTCGWRESGRFVAVAVPRELASALEPFRAGQAD
jgi:enediyne biosynthesis thioesterase